MWSLEHLLRRPDLPVRTVTRDAFIEVLTARGETLAKAELQAKWAVALGSQVLVGDEYLKIDTAKAISPTEGNPNAS